MYATVPKAYAQKNLVGRQLLPEYPPVEVRDVRAEELRAALTDTYRSGPDGP